MSDIVKPASVKNYTKASLGDIVLWYTDGDIHSPPHPAIVTHVGEQTLTVNILGPDLRSFVIKSGVHHISSPSSQRVETRDSGAWDHTTRYKLIQELIS